MLQAFQAVHLGHTDVLHYLLANRIVPVHVTDSLGRTLLFVAVLYKQYDCACFLLENVEMVDIDACAQSGNTALHAATSNGDAQMVSLLLQAGANR